jgi:predicted GH43/DUF377 family glycosyl hydrolase
VLGGAAMGGAVVLGGAALAFTPLGTKVNNHLPCEVRALEPSEWSVGARAAAPGWHLSAANPVLNVQPTSGWESAAVYDPCVIRKGDESLAMWYSTRGSRPGGIALAVDGTGTGDTWTRVGFGPVLTVSPPEQYAYGAVTRPSVLATADGWRMWYSIQGTNVGAGEAWIGTAISPDGIHWQKHGSPLLTPHDAWEKTSLQCPNVLYDAGSGQYMMWYCGGEQYEPDAVGFATSPDGITWTRYSGNPIYKPATGWEDYKVGSFQVHKVGDWYYAFYNAFQQQPFVCRVGMARSRDGVTNWERHPNNPILAPGRPCTWNAAMVYKPTALWDERKRRWDVWFNASAVLNAAERIGHAWSDGLW